MPKHALQQLSLFVPVWKRMQQQRVPKVVVAFAVSAVPFAVPAAAELLHHRRRKVHKQQRVHVPKLWLPQAKSHDIQRDVLLVQYGRRGFVHFKQHVQFKRLQRQQLLHCQRPIFWLHRLRLKR